MSQFINFGGTSDVALAKFRELNGELYWDNKKVLLQDTNSLVLPDTPNIIAYFDSSNSSKKTLDVSGGTATVSNWQDSVNGHVISQPLKSKQPANISNAQNNKESVLFGQYWFMSNLDTILNEDNYPNNTASIIVAFSIQTATTNRGTYNILQTSNYTDNWWRYVDGFGYMAEFRSPRIEQYPAAMPLVQGNYIISIRSGLTEYEVRVNGVSKGTRIPSFSRHNTFQLNKEGSGLDGFIYGCFIRRGESQEAIQESEHYLNDSWDLGVL